MGVGSLKYAKTGKVLQGCFKPTLGCEALNEAHRENTLNQCLGAVPEANKSKPSTKVREDTVPIKGIFKTNTEFRK